MKRVLSLTTTGLFVTGLALLPMSVRAEQAVTGGKDGKPAAAMSTTAVPPAATSNVPHTTTSAVPPAATSNVPPAAALTVPHTATTVTTPVKKSDDKHVTSAPSNGANTVVKPPVKGAS